jgi:predicted transcriptional regulator
MLTTQEAACLDIMQTEDMLAIGNWAPVVQSLVDKGLARHVEGQMYGITAEGMKALDDLETEEMRGMIAEHNARVVQNRERIGPIIEGEAEEVPCQP